jgi:hypothetical protein
MMPVLRRSLFLLGFLLVASCNSNSPYYRLQFTMPWAVSLEPGQSTQFEVTLNRVGDQPGELRVNMESAPEGITMTPEIIVPEGEGITTQMVTVNVAQDIAVTGAQRTLLLANDSGKDLVSGAELYVVVLPATTSQPEFSIALAQRQLTLFVGQSELTPVQITRAEGFTGPLTLSLESDSRRITAQPVVVPGDQASANILITTTTSVARIPVAVTVVATAEDGRTARTSLTLDMR